eukprot:3651606-Ditylum_brightwellii.AAC.1
MAMETKQVEVGKSLTKLFAANAPTHAKPKNTYVSSKKPTKAVHNPYVVTSTPTKNEATIKNSITLPETSTSKQYYPAEFFPTLKTYTESLGPGTKPVYIPAVHNLPCKQTTIVSHETTMNTYKPIHRWNISQPTSDVVPYASAPMSAHHLGKCHSFQTQLLLMRMCLCIDGIPVHLYQILMLFLI